MHGAIKSSKLTQHYDCNQSLFPTLLCIHKLSETIHPISRPALALQFKPHLHEYSKLSNRLYYRDRGSHAIGELSHSLYPQHGNINIELRVGVSDKKN